MWWCGEDRKPEEERRNGGVMDSVMEVISGEK
jgi:hypothetical protein